MLRARPPQKVADDPRRTAVFVAALEQSEQLMRAAECVGTAARPLPLFYALSQAGRAITATKLDRQWRLYGHGLSMVEDGAIELLRRRVGLNPINKNDRQDSFAGAGAAVCSEPLTEPVELGEIWAAMPDLVEPMPQMPVLSGVTWRRPLRAYPQRPRPDQPLADKLTVLVSGLPDGLDAAGMEAELEHYLLVKPASVATLEWVGKIHAWQIRDPISRVVATPSTAFQIPDDPAEPLYSWLPGGEKVPALIFPDITVAPRHPSRADAILPPYRGDPGRLIRPRIGAEKSMLAPLMLWWVLLFGLSMVARYDPELWVEAIDPRNERAVPIEAALEDAMTAVPELILEALTG
jgi:hypothetical protein